MMADHNRTDEQERWAKFPDVGELMPAEGGYTGYKRHGLLFGRSVGGVNDPPHDENGRACGPWRFELDDGHMMECPMVAGMPHRYWPDDTWVVRSADGDMAEGPYKHGKRHGLWDFRYADGTKEKVKFRHGKFAEFVE